MFDETASMEYKCCATCEYGSYDEMQGYVCVNGDSEYVADFVEADHSCVDYVTKEADQNASSQIQRRLQVRKIR